MAAQDAGATGMPAGAPGMCDPLPLLSISTLSSSVCMMVST